MSDVMQALHNDHSNFARLLDVLKETLATLREGGRPRYHLILDVVDYLENYGDMYHHPKEDLIYEFHLERSDEGRATIAELMQQHRSLKQLTTRLRRSVEGLLHDAVIPRQQFIDQLAEFIDRQAEHLDAEEARVFPLLKASLTTSDWDHIDAIQPARTDPLFGQRVEEQYEALLERIAETT